MAGLGLETFLLPKRARTAGALSVGFEHGSSLHTHEGLRSPVLPFMILAIPEARRLPPVNPLLALTTFLTC